MPGRRLLIPFENTQRRRVNALVAYRPGPQPFLHFATAPRSWTSADLLAFLRRLPWAKVPRVVVLDNASLHISTTIRDARLDLQRRGIYLYYLPPYSPELNRVEPVLKQVKYHWIPVRSHDSLDGLEGAVWWGFSRYHCHLHQRVRQLRQSA